MMVMLEGNTFKNFALICGKTGRHWYFPAKDRKEAVIQARRHSVDVGIKVYKVKVIGKWLGDETTVDPSTFKVK